MHVMRVDWNPVSEERVVPVRFFPGPAVPTAPKAEPEQDAAEEQAEAKVVRTQRRKGPRASSADVETK